jgi:hypothetical protein
MSVFREASAATVPGALLLACIAASVPAAAPQTPRPDAPNIIFIMADDLGYGELGSYGQKRIRTPRLDRMAAEGMRFTQFYSGSPVCAPSRGTLLTGLHTGHAYVRDNHELGGFRDEEERGQLALPPDTPTLARALSSRGYTTAISIRRTSGATRIHTRCAIRTSRLIKRTREIRTIRQPTGSTAARTTRSMR